MSLDIACIDTICALSSAPAPAALAIVRASGPQAQLILSRIFHSKATFKALKALHGTVCDSNNNAIDDCVALFYEAEQSFTGEQSFEIFCHGNPLIIDEILKTLCAHGARLAQAGEFSMRALLNKKINLAQAESIADLIHAQSLAAKNLALKGVQGILHKHCAPIQKNIIAALAEIEARMDFPDEDLASYDRAHIRNLIINSCEHIDKLLKQASYALKLHEGIRLVICGLPNAGKSTLFNRLCNSDRAIVHESAGTTRDVIEARITIAGIPITLVDVAGIREVGAEHAIEKLGIERAYDEIRQAQLVIWLADYNAKEPFSDAIISEKLYSADALVVRVLNKVDSDEILYGDDNFRISARLNLGIDKLLAHIEFLLRGPQAQNSELFITRARQRDELLEAKDALLEALKALDDYWADEVITAELRRAGCAFDRLFGSFLSEDVLDTIFSQFCIGK
jgi:tRNA modification GTPase